VVAKWTGQGLGLVLAVLAIGGVTAHSSDAQARSAHHSAFATSHGSHYPVVRYTAWRGSYGRHVSRGYTSLRSWASSGLQCVPFARENSGIELSGNAGTWWDNAEGLYERGAKPEVGSILNFRSTSRMRMGHVAVVTNVLDGRHIQIDHANWASPGRISRDIDVVDVSSSNDWTAVRVELDHTNEFGSVYPTHGFIYDRPDGGVMLANNGVATAPVLNAAPADLRPAVDRIEQPTIPTAPEEVAEAADDSDDGMAGSGHYGHRWTHHHGRATLRHVVAYGHGRIPVVKAASFYRMSGSSVAPVATGHRHRRS